MRRFAEKTIAVVAIAIMLAATIAVPASAISTAPYEGYNYDPYGVATASPVGYLPDEEYDYKDMELDVPLNSPEDLFKNTDLDISR